MYGEEFGIRQVGTAAAGGGDGDGGASGVVGWDSDLADKAAFLAMTEWDASFAVGCTQAQAEDVFSVNAGDLEMDTGDAVTAGADADFKARWWLTEMQLPQMDISLRAERIATGLDSLTPFGLIRFCAHHFASDVAASPSTPTDVSSYFASWIGLEMLSHAANFSTKRGLFTTAPTGTVVNDFIRFHASVFRAHQLSGTSQTVLQVQHHASSYTLGATVVSTTDGSRVAGEEYTEGRRLRFAIEIDPDAGADMSSGGDEQLNIRFPRLRLVVAS